MRLYVENTKIIVVLVTKGGVPIPYSRARLATLREAKSRMAGLSLLCIISGKRDTIELECLELDTPDIEMMNVSAA
jgi:hypothetical protein